MGRRCQRAAAASAPIALPLASSRDFRVALSEGSIGVGSPARPNHPTDPPVRRSDLVELFPNDLPLRKFIRARRAPASHSAADDARAEHEARQTMHGLPAARVARSRAAREAVAARGPQESKSAAEQQPVRRARGDDCLWLSLHSRGLPQLWQQRGRSCAHRLLADRRGCRSLGSEPRGLCLRPLRALAGTHATPTWRTRAHTRRAGKPAQAARRGPRRRCAVRGVGGRRLDQRASSRAYCACLLYKHSFHTDASLHSHRMFRCGPTVRRRAARGRARTPDREVRASDRPAAAGAGVAARRSGWAAPSTKMARAGACGTRMQARSQAREHAAAVCGPTSRTAAAGAR